MDNDHAHAMQVDYQLYVLLALCYVLSKKIKYFLFSLE